MCREWPAFDKWRSTEYLRNKAGDEIISVEKTSIHNHDFAYYQTEKFSTEEMTYRQFIETIRDPNRKFNYYYAE